MSAAIKNLYIEQGATYRLPFQWASKAVDGTITPHEVVGWTARMQFRTKVTATVVLLEATTENGMITLAAEGHIAIVISDEDTMLLTVKRAVYDFEIEDTLGNVYRLLQGEVEINPNVTRDA